MEKTFDVAIVGGGPGGSTVGALLKKYAPHLEVAIFEREKFPREHVGESLLPVVSTVLAEMGCWDQIESADFPVKVGATYRWGSSDDLWDFDFLNGAVYEDAARPAPYEGQRKRTAFQVDRAKYDAILLNHAKSLGVKVFEGVSVTDVSSGNRSIEWLQLDGGKRISARYYIDASGHSGLLRRKLEIETTVPTCLKNIAVWSYWDDAKWAVSVGASGTRIQVMSLGWGWIWFIPVGPTRTSVGLVMPAGYPKERGKTAAELYDLALDLEPRIRLLLTNATRETARHATKDWSFVSSQTAGANWFLVGESAGFADPILSAGLTLTQVGAWETAVAIVELDNNRYDADWIRFELERQHRRRVMTHIRFADYWYAANGHFTELVEYTATIAREAGLALDGSNAWQWLGTGGFVDTDLGGAGVGGFSLLSAGWLVRDFSAVLPTWEVGRNNLFLANPAPTALTSIAAFRPGYIDRIAAYEFNGKYLPAEDICGFFLGFLKTQRTIAEILEAVRAGKSGMPAPRSLQVLEAMVNDGWILATHDSGQPLLDVGKLMDLAPFHKNFDTPITVD